MGKYEAVRKSTIRPGTGAYALMSSDRVAYVTSFNVKMAGVPGGRSTQCWSGYGRQRHVMPGCQIVTLAAPIKAGSHLTFTVSYAGAPQVKQSFVATADGSGHYQGAFPVMYMTRNTQGVRVTVTLEVTLGKKYSYWSTATRCFVDLPVRS
jgi:hypothetical protein